MQKSNQAYERKTQADEDVLLGFKRLILEETQAFEQTPEADLYRVRLLAMMHERYDNYTANGAQDEAARAYVRKEFSDLRSRMRGEGFEEYDLRENGGKLWPPLSEDDAAQYIKQRSAKTCRRAAGFVLCIAFIVPITLSFGLSELLNLSMDEAAGVASFVVLAMIGYGIYAMITAKKPEQEERIKKNRFILSRRLRGKLEELKAAADEKWRRDKKHGFRTLLLGLVTFPAGAAISSVLDYPEAAFSLSFSVALLLGFVGIYQLLTAGAKKKAIGLILKD